MTDQAISIRPAKDGEKQALKLIMNNAFPFLMRLFFTFSKHILVAEKNGELIGGNEIPNAKGKCRYEKRDVDSSNLGFICDFNREIAKL